MKDLLELIRDAERWRGRYEGYAMEWNHRASQARLQDDQSAVEKCEHNEAVYTREAERERQRAEHWAQALERKQDNIRRHNLGEPVLEAAE